MAGIEQILEDFKKIKAACREMEDKKILVGIVGDAGSDVMEIGRASCRERV